MRRGIIIPAAGLATRMRPLTNAASKAMLSVNGKPILEYILSDLLRRNSTSEIVIVTGKLDDIETYVLNNYHDEVMSGRIKLTTQPTMNGPLGAIEIGASVLEDDVEEVVIWLGDTLCDDYDDTRSDYLMTSSVEDQENWCLIDHDNNFYDKPKYDEDIPTKLALIGIYSFGRSKDFFKSLNEAMSDYNIEKEYQIKALLVNYILMFENHFDLIETNNWYDCGNLENYYSSKARLLSKSSRSFNTMTVDPFYGTVTKSSNVLKGQEKIEREKEWFNSVEDEGRLFIPQIIPNDNYGELTMSWESGVPLNELFIYENVSISNKIHIMKRVLDIYMNVFYKHQRNTGMIHANQKMFYRKNVDRLNEYNVINYKKIIEMQHFIACAWDELKDEEYISTIHGDLHTGNILFDPFNGKIKLIDPRGHYGDYDTNLGDIRYDFGKLMHDFYVGYNYMLAGQYEIEDDKVIIKWDEKEQNILMDTVLDKIETKFKINRVLLQKLGIIFVATCLPFHNDNPKLQEAFWLRAVNLMEKMNESVYTV